jgi:hypothetical protein
MSNVRNNTIQVIIDADDLIVIQDLVIEFNVIKDLDEEPNEATITVYNLEAEKRNRIIDPTVQDIPVSLYISQGDSDELVLLFSGEIDRVENQATKPGYATTLHCMSQKEHHRAKYIDKKTYATGTPYSQIVDDFLSVIDMPSEKLEIPQTGIGMSYSFSGPAFKLLQRFVYGLGMFCYILDGVIYISSVYEPATPVAYEIARSSLLEAPMSTERVDSKDVELRTVIDTVNIDPFAKERKRKKRITKIKYGDKGKKRVVKREVVDTSSEPSEVTATFDAVDSVITGADFMIIADPNIQPDYLVALSDDFETKYRVKEVNTYGDNWGGDWTTELKCDDFYDYLSNQEV